MCVGREYRLTERSISSQVRYKLNIVPSIFNHRKNLLSPWFCYINPLAALFDDLTKIACWICLLQYSLWGYPIGAVSLVNVFTKSLLHFSEDDYQVNYQYIIILFLYLKYIYCIYWCCTTVQACLFNQYIKNKHNYELQRTAYFK